MNKHIATVKSAQGDVLELREIISIGFERDLNILQINTNDCIVRSDGKTVPFKEGTGYHFDQENLENSQGFTEEEAQEILDLKDEFLVNLKAVLERKAIVEHDEVVEGEPENE